MRVLAHHARQAPRAQPVAPDRNRAGFTLMEVLLVAMLSVVLMMGLWSLFGTYLKLFSSGEARVERSQLMRALARQFADDFNSAIQAPPRKLPASQSRSTSHSNSDSFSSPSTFESTPSVMLSETSNVAPSGPQFGLMGTDRTLLLEVLQSAPLPWETGGSAPSWDGLEFSTEPRAPEFKTVLYTFEEPRKIQPADRKPAPGLLRREIDWETRIGAIGGQTAVSGSNSNAEDDIGFQNGFPELSAADLAASDVLDDRIIWAREVVACRFRYYDGTGWTTEWDSYERKSMPVAVEISFRLRDGDRPSPESTSSDDDDTLIDQELADVDDDDDELNEADANGDDETGVLGPTEYRQVIHLPFAQQAGDRFETSAFGLTTSTSGREAAP